MINRVKLIMKLLLIVLIGIVNLETIASSSDASSNSLSSILSLKNIHNFVENISPFLPKPTKNGESRDKKSFHIKALNDVRKFLSKAALNGESWLTFAKRAASYAMTGSVKEAIKDEKALNTRIAKKLIEHSPQFLKDSLEAQMKGSILPVLKKRFVETLKEIELRQGVKSPFLQKSPEDVSAAELEKQIGIIIKNYEKQKKETRADGPEGKQGTPFDPLVFGVNALINFFWFTSFNTMMLQNMGLENLFFPDYDYEYEDEEGEEEELLSEEEEGEEGEEGGEGEEAAAAPGLFPNDEIDNTIDGGAFAQSSYSHYPGQRMKLNPTQFTHPGIPKGGYIPQYYLLKMYNPDKHR